MIANQLLMVKNLNKFINIFSKLTIFVYLFIALSTPIYSSFANHKQYSWDRDLDSLGEQLRGVSILQDLPVSDELYQSYRSQYANGDDVETEYAEASIDMMSIYMAKLQNKIANLSWLTDEDRINLLEDIDAQLGTLSQKRYEVRTLQSDQGVAERFQNTKQEWLQFREKFRLQFETIVANSVDAKCKSLNTDQTAAFLEDSAYMKLFVQFTASCEDWGRDGNMLPSESLLEFIKQVK